MVRGGFDSEGYGFFLVRGGFSLVRGEFFSEGGDIFRSPAILTRKEAVFFWKGYPVSPFTGIFNRRYTFKNL